jgi:hypothetical protein
MSGNAGKGSRPRPVDKTKWDENYDKIFSRRKTVRDGFGGVWQKCQRPDCGLSVVWPGKVQCWCDVVDNEEILEDS